MPSTVILIAACAVLIAAAAGLIAWTYSALGPRPRRGGGRR